MADLVDAVRILFVHLVLKIWPRSENAGLEDAVERKLDVGHPVQGGVHAELQVERKVAISGFFLDIRQKTQGEKN